MAAEIRTTSSTGGQKGVKLERPDLIPIGPQRELAAHFGRGALKYAEHQWRAGYEWSKSYSALVRHLNLFWQGFDYDVCSNEPENCAIKIDTGQVLTFHAHQARWIEEYGRIAIIRINDRNYKLPDNYLYEPDTCYNHTGSHHMVAVAWHSFVLLEFKDRFPEFDDRYKPEVKEEKPAKPVCMCTNEERTKQGHLVNHYLEIHGIQL